MSVHQFMNMLDQAGSRGSKPRWLQQSSTKLLFISVPPSVRIQPRTPVAAGSDERRLYSQARSRRRFKSTLNFPCLLKAIVSPLSVGSFVGKNDQEYNTY